MELKALEDAGTRCARILRQEAGLVGLMWVPFPFSDQPFAIGVHGLMLALNRNAPPDGVTEHWKWGGANIEVLRMPPERLDRLLAADDNGRWAHWVARGEILDDPEGVLAGYRRMLADWPESERDRKMLGEFSRFLEMCVRAKQDMKEGRVADAFSHIVDSIHHWARIVMLEEGLHPGLRVWHEIRRINPGIYKLFEELTTSGESAEKRVQLLLLACEFAVLTKMKTSCALLLRILASRAAPWTVQELLRHPELSGLNLNLALVLQMLVKRGHVREEIPALPGGSGAPVEVRYTAV